MSLVSYAHSHWSISLLSCSIIPYSKSLSVFYSIVICWEALPGFFLFMRLFLIYFQDFYISKLSSGILRMNLAIDRVILDTVAYKMW